MTNKKSALGAFVAVLFASASVFAPVSSAQLVDISVGPQVTTLGVGVSASARVAGHIGVSLEYNLFPLSKTEKSGFNNSLLIEPSLQGGKFMATFHPSGGKFTLGAGILAGGLNADVVMALDPQSDATIELGNGEYSAAGVGNLSGSLEYGSSVQPSVMLGWTGPGLNFAIGAALATPALTLEASGPLKNDPGFKADLDLEIQDFDDAVGSVPVFPYLRLGWQFSF